MLFICWQSPSTSHNPYPGTQVDAVDSQAAAAQFATLANISSGNVLVVEKASIKAFAIGGAHEVPLPNYV